MPEYGASEPQPAIPIGTGRFRQAVDGRRAEFLAQPGKGLAAEREPCADVMRPGRFDGTHKALARREAPPAAAGGIVSLGVPAAYTVGQRMPDRSPEPAGDMHSDELARLHARVERLADSLRALVRVLSERGVLDPDSIQKMAQRIREEEQPAEGERRDAASQLCPFCRSGLPEEATRCGRCGADVEAVAARAEGLVPCPSCGENVPEGAFRCLYCGAPLPRRPDATRTTEKLPVPAPPTEALPAPEDRIECPDCGGRIAPETGRCEGCGAEYDASAWVRGFSCPRCQKKNPKTASDCVYCRAGRDPNGGGP